MARTDVFFYLCRYPYYLHNNNKAVSVKVFLHSTNRLCFDLAIFKKALSWAVTWKTNIICINDRYHEHKQMTIKIVKVGKVAILC